MLYKNKNEWKVREKHEKEVRQLLKDHGCLDSKNRLMGWNGPVMYEALRAAGHSSLDFWPCSCREQNEERGII